MSESAEASEFSIDKIAPIPIHHTNMGNPNIHDAERAIFLTPSLEEEELLAWSKIRNYCQDFFSEFLGTMTLILFGDGVVAQVVLSGGTKGDYQSISWGWG
jgi:aquaglyceroporin related protein